MPIPIAMALSGIEREHWGDFKDLYDHGTKVMAQRKSRSFSRSTNSTASSRGSSRTSSRASSPSSSRESGIGSISPEISSHAVPLTLRDYCLFKIEAMQYGDKDALKIIEMFDLANSDPDDKLQEPLPIYEEKLPWTGRNLLELNDNLRGNATMYLPAHLPTGVQGYFDNRSQISRVQGAYAPPYVINKCINATCQFEEFAFY